MPHAAQNTPPRSHIAHLAVTFAVLIHTATSAEPRFLPPLDAPQATSVATESLPTASVAAEPQQGTPPTLADRLVDASRRVYVLSPEPERPALLRALLADPIPELRLLGLEIAERELSSGPLTDPDISAAIAVLLDEPNPPVRRRAARILERLNDDAATQAVLTHVATETDPSTATSLLRAAARSRSPEALTAAKSWITEPGPPREAAAVILALANDRAELDDNTKATIRREFAAAPPGALGPASIRLLGAIADDAGRARVGTALAAPDAATRRAAAEAAAAWPELLWPIIDAARADVALLPLAAEAARAHDPTLPTYEALADLDLDLAPRRTHLLRVAECMPPTDLRVAAITEPDPLLRELLLADLIREDRDLPLDQADIPNIRVLLARARQDLDRPDAALAALAPLDQTRARPVRLWALLATGRLDDAEALGLDLDAWPLAIANIRREEPHAAAQARLEQLRPPSPNPNADTSTPTDPAESPSERTPARPEANQPASDD